MSQLRLYVIDYADALHSVHVVQCYSGEYETLESDEFWDKGQHLSTRQPTPPLSTRSYKTSVTDSARANKRVFTINRKA